MRGRSHVVHPPAGRDGGTSRNTGPLAAPDTEEVAMNPTRVTQRLPVILAGSRPPPWRCPPAKAPPPQPPTGHTTRRKPWLSRGKTA
jgi:hypothetical protein